MSVNTNLDALTTDVGTIELLNSSGGVLFPIKGDEGEALPSVVHVDDASALFELALKRQNKSINRRAFKCCHKPEALHWKCSHQRHRQRACSPVPPSWWFLSNWARGCKGEQGYTTSGVGTQCYNAGSETFLKDV